MGRLIFPVIPLSVCNCTNYRYRLPLIMLSQSVASLTKMKIPLTMKEINSANAFEPLVISHLSFSLLFHKVKHYNFFLFFVSGINISPVVLVNYSYCWQFWWITIPNQNKASFLYSVKIGKGRKSNHYILILPEMF